MSNYQLGCVCHFKPQLPDDWCDGSCAHDDIARQQVDQYTGGPMTTNDGHDALTLEALREWLEKQDSETIDEFRNYKSSYTEGISDLARTIIDIIDAGRLPND